MRCSCGLMLAALPWMGGCAQQTGAETPGLVSLAMADATNPVAASEEATPLPATTETPVPLAPPSDMDDPAPAALPAPSTGTVLPPNIRPSSPLADVVKMAQSGVDEAVVLAFITNATGTFSLGSEEIIYLNDLGVSNELITAMMDRDQVNKQFWTSNAQPKAIATAPVAAATSAEPAEAAAPSYVTPPQATPTEPQPEIASNDYFYDTLSPYGTWVNIDGYGLCWQPTVVVVNRHWQPYSDRGRWIYTDAGWYWLSDYSWGWATFHYGRWFRHARWGWCWWPDRVWAPSWVTWRYSGDYCGWAPLPPAAIYRPGFGFSYYGRSVGFSFDFGIAASWYTFVPVSRFCDPRPYHHRLPPHHVTKIYNNTTVINNYGSGNRNTVINRGIAPERISAVTKTEIRPVTLRDGANFAGRGGRGERLEQDGQSLVVRRPHFPESAGEIRTATTGRAPSQPVAGRTEELRSRVPRASEGVATHNPREELRSPRSSSNLEHTRIRTPVAGIEAAGRNTPSGQSPGVNAPVRPATPPVSAVTPRSEPASRVAPSSSRGESVAGRERPDVQRPSQPATSRSADRPPQAVPSRPAPAPTAPRSQVQMSPTTPTPATPTRSSSSLVVIGGQDRQAPTTSRTPAPPISGSTGRPIGSPRPSTTDPLPSRAQAQSSRSDNLRIPLSDSRTSYSEPAGPSLGQRSLTSPAPSPRTTIQPPQGSRTPSFVPPPAVARPQPAAPAMSAPPAPSVSPAPIVPAPRVQASPPPSSRPEPAAPSRSDSGSRGRDRR